MSKKLTYLGMGPRRPERRGTGEQLDAFRGRPQPSAPLPRRRQPPPIRRSTLCAAAVRPLSRGLRACSGTHSQPYQPPNSLAAGALLDRRRAECHRDRAPRVYPRVSRLPPFRCRGSELDRGALAFAGSTGSLTVCFDRIGGRRTAVSGRLSCRRLRRYRGRSAPSPPLAGRRSSSASPRISPTPPANLWTPCWKWPKASGSLV